MAKEVLMKAFKTLVALLILATAAATVKGSEAPAAVLPHLSMDSVTKDVGAVRKGVKIEAVFEVRNTGPAPLVISEARPSCGCTVATFDREIGPGEAGKIRASVETKNFSGPITKTVTVVSNDPERPQLALTIKADVRP
jgi:hypothetical protein